MSVRDHVLGLIDKDGSGRISTHELRRYLQQQELPFKREDEDAVIEYFDTSGEK